MNGAVQYLKEQVVFIERDLQSISNEILRCDTEIRISQNKRDDSARRRDQKRAERENIIQAIMTLENLGY